MSILMNTIEVAEYLGISPALLKKMRTDAHGPQ